MIYDLAIEVNNYHSSKCQLLVSNVNILLLNELEFFHVSCQWLINEKTSSMVEISTALCAPVTSFRIHAALKCSHIPNNPFLLKVSLQGPASLPYNPYKCMI